MSDKVLKIFPILVLVFVSVIMIHNIYSHPVDSSYDYLIHMKAFSMNADSYDIKAKMPAGLDYNPSLYYFGVGKLYRLWSSFFDVELHVFFRYVHFLSFILLYFLFVFRLFPIITDNRLITASFALLMGIVPNIYLSMVMPRADLLFFVSVNLLFFIWLFNSRKRSAGFANLIIPFGILLIIMANTRHIAAAAWGIFFLIFIYELILFIKSNIGVMKKIIVTCLLFIVFAGSGYFYFTDYLPSLTGQKTELKAQDKWIDLYHGKYRKLGERMGVAGRLRMFGNLRFDKLFMMPNRTAKLCDTASIDEFEMKFFRKNILYKIKSRKDRKILLSCYKKDFSKQKYILRSDIPRKLMLEYKSILFGVMNLGNAFWPRLYGDMWGDHWLYFSGKKGEDRKTLFKRIVFVAAIPVSLMYFLLPLLSFRSTVMNILNKRVPGYSDIAGTVFLLGMLTLMVFVWLDPETGKNSTVKFTYMIGYALFPFFCITDWMERNVKYQKMFAGYIFLLFLSVAPLNIFWV